MEVNVKAMAHINTPRSSTLGKAVSARLHWLVMGAGVAASAACSLAIIARSPDIEIHFALNAGEKGRSIAALATPQDRASGPAQTLAGINGETFGSNEPGDIAESMLAEDKADTHIAPAAWDDLSDARCLTVTTREGQTFSFRVKGVHPKSVSKKPDNGSKVELDIAACAENGEPVAKALIEPDAAAPIKNVATPASERSL